MHEEDKILAIDIGGSHIKATVLDHQGLLQTDYKKVITPDPATPTAIIAAIRELLQSFLEFDKISVGFPGYVKNGTVLTAPNLGTKAWNKVPLAQLLQEAFGKPAKVINDADMQGLGIVSGRGVEMVVTLGTGFGTALFFDGKLMPHLELAHHPISKKATYDEYIGQKALDKIGLKKWNKRMKKVIEVLKTVFNYDTLYIGGGNARRLDIEMDLNIKTVTNKDGIDGGAKLWN